MITNRYLPQWLHRVACGVIAAALVATLASAGLPYSDAESWLQMASRPLLWLTIPVGLVAASAAHRFSIVEGCAGEVGYEDLDSDHNDNPST
jgi:hypothetical protein